MSIKEIVEETDPDIIVLTDTWYKNNEEIKLKAYKLYTSNRENKKGGIEIPVINNVQNRTLKLSVRTETKNRALNMGK